MLNIYKDKCLELQGLHSTTTPPQTTASEMTAGSSKLFSDSQLKHCLAVLYYRTTLYRNFLFLSHIPQNNEMAEFDLVHR